MQNEISKKFLEGSDLAKREQEVLKDASKKLKFDVKQLLERSAWWNSKSIGAFSYTGVYQGKKSVLKIQGVKPQISEAQMIKNFAKRNKSKIIRPPALYAHLPWDNLKRYEALVLEKIDGQKIVNTPTNQKEVDDFFDILAEYRTNCLNSPWTAKPRESVADQTRNNFEAWRKIRRILYKNHPLIKSADEELIDQAVILLVKNYAGTEPKFMHAHLSERDPQKVAGEIVIFSNLFWLWRAPFYDIIFAYHWFMYHLSDVSNITPQKVEQQRNLWLSKIRTWARTAEEKRLLNLALLERAAAGLNLDALSVDPQKPIAEYLVSSTREQIKKLIGDIPFAK